MPAEAQTQMSNLSKSDALKHLRRIRNKIPELESLDRNSVEIPIEYNNWRRDGEICIRYVFPEKPNYAQDFGRTSLEMLTSPSKAYDSEYQRTYLRALEAAAAILDSMIGEIEEFWPDSGQAPPAGPQTNGHPKSNEVFVIHGKDNNLKNEVARLLTQVGLKPIILAEQPSRGLTIIEKFEQHADVAFAIALLTPDDHGSENGTKEQMSRARQNVIFELGFFICKLGRERVCALIKGSVEIPSDYSGVVYIDVEQASEWKYELARELREAGLNADANKIQ